MTKLLTAGKAVVGTVVWFLCGLGLITIAAHDPLHLGGWAYYLGFTALVVGAYVQWERHGSVGRWTATALLVYLIVGGPFVNALQRGEHPVAAAAEGVLIGIVFVVAVGTMGAVVSKLDRWWLARKNQECSR